MGIHEQIEELENELRNTKVNKRTEHAVGLLKAKLAKLREDAIKKIKNGQPVMGQNNGKKGKDKGKGDGEKGDGKGKGKGGKGKKGGKGGGSFSQSDDISFHDLPETILPEKE